MSDLDYIDQSPSRDHFKYLRPAVFGLGVAAVIAWATLDWRSLLGVALVVPVAYYVLLRASNNVIANQTAHAQMVCPHCHTRGTVRLKSSKVKRGISGGKATAGVLTGGWSLLAIGLSRKEKGFDARCTKCGVNWRI